VTTACPAAQCGQCRLCRAPDAFVDPHSVHPFVGRVHGTRRSAWFVLVDEDRVTARERTTQSEEGPVDRQRRVGPPNESRFWMANSTRPAQL
jgi:hypothetical protein